MESFAYILVGDLGGTNARFDFKKVNRADHSKREVIKSGVLNSQDFASFDDLFGEFLQEYKGSEVWPEIVCLGITGVVQNNTVKISVNLKWPLMDGAEIEKKFGVKRVIFLNDFVANGFGVLNLNEGDFVKLTDAPVVEGAPKALLGAGTGLGQAFLLKGDNSKNYDVFPSEGGQTDFAARNDLEYELLKFAKNYLNLPNCTIQNVCEGPAINLIYEFFKSRHPELERVIEKEGKDPKDILPKDIIDLALSSKDPLTTKVLELFTSIFGSEGGNLSMRVLPLGGLYLLSGVTIAIKDYILNTSIFLDNFYAKGLMTDFVKQVPIFIVVKPIAVQGAEECALRLI